jgi:hypothetical protein
MNNPGNPHDWKSHDEAVSDLYQATRDIEPPAWLDESILAAARTAVAPSLTPATPRSRRRSTRLWAIPVALAVTVIMAVGIVRLAQETGNWMPPNLEAPMPVQSLAEPAAEASASFSSQRELDSAKQQPAATPPLSAPPPPAAPATRMMRSEPSMREEGELMPEQRFKQNILQTRPVMQDENTEIRRQRANRSPEEWLADIARLRQQGRTAEARASLEEFQRRYPSHPPPTGEGTD